MFYYLLFFIKLVHIYLFAFKYKYNKFFNEITAIYFYVFNGWFMDFIFLNYYFSRIRYFLIKKFYTDIFLRFTNRPLFSINFPRLSRNWSIHDLPIFANIHISFWVLRCRALQLMVGSWEYLPLNCNFSGIYMPYLLLYNKKPFWYSYGRVFFFKDLWLKFFFKTKFIFTIFKRLSLITNFRKKITFKILKQFRRRRFNFVSFLNLSSSMKYNQSKFMLFKYFFSCLDNDLNFNKRIVGRLGFLKGFKKKKFKIRGLRNRFLNIRKRQLIYLKWYRGNLKYFFKVGHRAKVITKFCTRFKKQTRSSFKYLKEFELRLINVVLRSKFVILFKDAIYLIESGYVFVNGVVTYNESFILKKGDRVNILLSQYLHILYRNCFSGVITRYYRMIPYRYILYKNSKNITRTKTKLTAKWILKSMWSESDVPKYLEVDFISMSTIIVFEPFIFSDIFSYYYTHIKIPNIRLYNWRYLF